MAFNEEQIEDMIFKILCAAESAKWEIYKGPASMRSRGSLMISGDIPFKVTPEENEAAMEAFDRMENELYFVRWVNHALYKVNDAGREALKAIRKQKERMSKELSVVGISFGANDAKAMDQWSDNNNAIVNLVGPFDPNFRENINKNIQTLLNVDNTDGFLIRSAADFKPTTLTTLYKLATSNNFYLYATDRQKLPFVDADFADSKTDEEQPTTAIHQTINYNVSGSQNVIASHGGINKQISNNLEIIHENNPDIAALLKDLTGRIEKSDLDQKLATELLQRIEDLTEEIGKNHPPERYWSIFERGKVFCERLVTIVTLGHGAHFLSEYAEKLLPLLTTNFGNG